MGRLLEHGGQFDLAVEHFEIGACSQPDAGRGGGRSRAAPISALRISTALAKRFDAALKLDPKRATVHLGLAQAHFQRTNSSKPRSRLNQAIAFDPQLKQARSLLARIHMREGDVGETKAAIEELLATRPDSVTAVPSAGTHSYAGRRDG